MVSKNVECKIKTSHIVEKAIRVLKENPNLLKNLNRDIDAVFHKSNLQVTIEDKMDFLSYLAEFGKINGQGINWVDGAGMTEIV